MGPPGQHLELMLLFSLQPIEWIVLEERTMLGVETE